VRRLLSELIQHLPLLPPGVVYTVIGIAASVENIFPPIPADTAVALGAYLSNLGTVSAWSVFAVTWVANVGSAAGVYAAARTLGRKFFTGRLGRRLLNPRHLERLERLYRRHGLWGIFLSRFVPGARAVIPPFAGIAGLSTLRALIPLAVASGIWYGLLTIAAANLIPRLDDVARFVIGLNWVALALGAGLAATVAWIGLRRAKLNRSRMRNDSTGGARGTGG
jgi:membrane protein DedA with SNARE-associated domain